MNGPAAVVARSIRAVDRVQGWNEKQRTDNEKSLDLS
jgi:hypothetical protein